MRMIYRAALAAIAVGVTAACHNDNNRATDSAYGTLPSNGPATGTAFSDTTNQSNASPSAASSGSASTAAGSVAPGMAAGAMTDGNILAKSEADDSSEVAIANYMASNTNNPRVRAFAILLRNDHSRGMTRIKSMQVPLQLQPNDTTAQETSHVLDHLKSLNGADRDTAFVNHEIEDHQADISDAQMMEQSAQGPQVKSVEQNQLAELKQHLDRAQALASQMGSK